jgi:hypothetical protein
VKQPGGVTLLPVAWWAWKERRARPLALVGLGVAAPIVLTALLVGVGEYLRWNLLGNSGFASPPPLGEAVQLLLEQGGLWIGLNAPLVLLLVLGWRARRSTAGADGGSARGVTDLWLWLAGGVLAVAVGWRFYGHYFLQLVPPASLLAAGYLASRAHRVRLGALVATGAIALGCGVAAFLADPADIVEPSVTEDAARAIRARSDPDDRVLVWGLAPEIYWESDRLPATRFVTTLSFLAGVQPSRDHPSAEPEAANRESWRDFVADFDAHPPRLVLDTAPAALKDAELAPISDYPRLLARVSGQYCFLREVRGMHLYRRTSGPARQAEAGSAAAKDDPLAAPCRD